MNRLIQISLITILLATASLHSMAQIVVEQDTTKDTAPSAYAGNITINADPRLAILVERHKHLQYGGIRHMRGYRVQIYYGNNRAEAIQRKVDFMRRYPKIQSYMVYTQPQYRVKVGNFATRQDAIDLYRQTIALYGACMIVPDYVTINYLEDD